MIWKKKNYLKKSSLFYKYLLSYIIIFLFPIIALLIFTYQHYIVLFKEEITTNHFNRLEQIKNTVDLNIKENRNTVYHMSYNNVVLENDDNYDSYHRYKIKQELTNYNMNNQFIDEIGFHIHGTDWILTSNSEYKFDIFGEKFFYYPEWSTEKLRQKITDINKQYLKPAENLIINNTANDKTQEKYITSFYPYPFYGHNNYGTVILFIKEKKVTDIIDNVQKRPDENTLILDNKGQIVSSLITRDYLSSNKFQDILKTISNKRDYSASLTHQINNQDYMISYINSADTGWTYITILPTRVYLNKINSLQSKLIYLLIFIFLIGSIIIYYLLHQNYDPIKKLKELVSGNIDDSFERSLGELQAISHSFDIMKERNETLHTRLQGNKTAIKEFILLNTLKGRILNKEIFNKKGELVDISFSRNYFAVIIFSFAEKIFTGKQGDQLKDQLEGIVQKEIEGYCKESYQDNTLLMIIGMDKSDIAVLKNKLENIRKEIEIMLEISCTIGAGNHYSSLQEVGKSYIEAHSALDYSFIKGNNTTIFFEEIPVKNNHVKCYPGKEYEELKRAIKKGNTEKIALLVNDIITTIKRNSLSLPVAKCLCFDIINLIIREIYESDYEPSIINEKQFDIFSLSNYDTIDELADILKQVCINLCNTILEQKDDSQNKRKEEYLTYVRQHCFEYSFSIQQMAEDFDLSSSYLSQHFKTLTGQTITDFVTEIRLEKAKDLLRTSSDPVKDIITDIGYIDVSSFSRKFKQITGITPGKYRKLYSGS